MHGHENKRPAINVFKSGRCYNFLVVTLGEYRGL